MTAQTGFSVAQAAVADSPFRARPCSKGCGEQRESEFYKGHSECKACKRKRINASYAADPQKFRDRINAARAADPQKFRDRKKAAYAADPQKDRDRKKAARAADPQKFRDRNKAARAADPQKFRDRDNACYRAGEDFAFKRAAASSPSGQEICSFPGCKVTLRFHLQFHHVDPATKLDEVSDLYRAPRKRLAAEVDKCILYCQHHHFQYHHPAPAPNPHPLFQTSPEVAARLAAL